MASKASAQPPVGCMQWVQSERDQIAQFQDQENEDFAFAARNEFEWLNEHMADIFSHNNLNVTEIFKTPGKLRGKTPRTARRKDALEGGRAPLTDVFASSIKYNGSPSRPVENGKKLQIQSSDASRHANAKNSSASTEKTGATQGLQPAENTLESRVAGGQLVTAGAIPQRVVSTASAGQQSEVSDGRRTTEGSFQSARENISKETPAPEVIARAVPGSFPRDTPMLVDDAPAASTSASHAVENVREPQTIPVEEQHVPETSPSSEGSTPEKPLVRKGSLNFASLPPREPLTTKKSIGHYTSNIETKGQQYNRNSYFGRLTGGKSLGNVPQPIDQDEMAIDSEVSHQAADAPKQLHKSYTQRLQDRINSLNKAPAPRAAKSMAHKSNDAFIATASTVELEKTRLSPIPGSQTVDFMEPPLEPLPAMEDDFIIPVASTTEGMVRPQLSKSRSVDVMEKLAGVDSVGGAELDFDDAERDAARIKSPLRSEPMQFHHPLNKAASTTHLNSSLHHKAASVSNPQVSSEGATTPPGSPSRMVTDGHLSASKSKLQSIMRSARGLFTSSAGISAQAKLEALSPSSSRIRLGGIDEILRAEAEEERHLYPTLPVESVATAVVNAAPVPRKTRSSTEREEKRKEEEVKERERIQTELASAKEEEISTAVATLVNKQVERTLESTSKPIRQSPRREAQEAKTMPAEEPEIKPAQPTSAATRIASQQGKGKEIRRIAKPAAKPAAKLQQLNIRVGTMRIPLTNGSSAASLHETVPPTIKQPGLAKKASNASLHGSASVSNLKGSVSGPKAKSLVATAQRKEQAEKEAQKKEDEKRERERRRVAAQEEAQRKEREHRQREEAERQQERERVAAEEAKRRAQKEAAEKRRAEATRKAQLQTESKRVAPELHKSVRGENNSATGHRPEAINRPPSRMEDVSRGLNGSRPINTAKAIKRVFDPDNDDELSRPTRPMPGQNYQQTTNDKRRRTGEEEEFRQTNRPTLQPPIRQSNMRKMQTSISHEQGFGHNMHGGGSKPSLFNNASVYPPTAPPPASSKQVHHMGAGPSMQPQQQLHAPSAQPIRVGGHPMDMAKYQNGKIPFAETAPHAPSAAPYKTPGQKPLAHMPPHAANNKSSPMYTNGEHIHLDDIATDSEEEDSEEERDRKQAMPEWARTPNLFEHLAGQETLNPDAVFGPIAPLNMEEMFRDKNRHHRFRNRTSSANWFGTDRLTEEDIRLDLSARERLRQDGGWTYGLGSGK